MTGCSARPAVTGLGPSITRSHVASRPPHAPPHPVKNDPVRGATVSVTPVPESYDSAQTPGHTMSPGELVTDPLPVPCFVTVSACGPEQLPTQAPAAAAVSTYWPITHMLPSARSRAASK